MRREEPTYPCRPRISPAQSCIDRMNDVGNRASGRRPLLVHEPEIARRLAARFQIAHLLTRHSERHVWALFMFLNGFATIGLLAAVAMVSRTPFVFPSLGPTAFLFFFTPHAPATNPGHT